MNTSMLRQLVRAGAVSQVVLRATFGGYILCARVGMEEDILEIQRGGARIFKSLDAAARFTHRLGLAAFEVDLSKFSSARQRV